MNIDSAPSQPSPTLLIHQTDLMLFQHTTAYLPQIGPRNTILPTYCEAQGKGRAKGRPRKVTQRSFIDRGGDTSMAGMAIAIPGVLNISKTGDTLGKIR